MIKQLRRLILGAGLLVVSTAALATACSAVQSCAANPGCANSVVSPGMTQLMVYQQSHPECFGSANSTAGASQAIGGTTIQQMLTISNAISARASALLAGPARTSASSQQQLGLAAGNAPSKINVWGSLSGDNSEYAGRSFVNGGGNTINIKSSLDVTNVVLGADYAISPSTVLGLSAAFDDGSGSTESFVNGASNAGSKGSTTKGYTVAPYLGWQIDKSWSVDATLGFGHVKLSTVDSLTGSADRMFYGANLSYAHWYGNWQLTGKGSYLYGQEKYGNLNGTTGTLADTASNNKMDQARISGQAAYWMDGFMPYLGLAYSSDLSRSTSGDAATQAATADLGKNAWVWSLGANFISLKNNMTGGIVYNQESGRTAGKRDSLMANINVRF